MYATEVIYKVFASFPVQTWFSYCGTCEKYKEIQGFPEIRGFQKYKAFPAQVEPCNTLFLQCLLQGFYIVFTMFFTVF